MTARVLVVDDVLPNIKLLEAKLTREYYDVFSAANGQDALVSARENNPDIVLLDVMMPGMDGFEVCRQMKADPAISHIPVVMVTALSDPQDRVQGLEAGADDFLTKPVNDVALFARVRSLVRLKTMSDELRLRQETSTSFGVVDSASIAEPLDLADASVLVVEDSPADSHNLENALSGSYRVEVVKDGSQAMARARDANFDLIVVSLGISSGDPLRLCSHIRTTEETRQVPVLILVEEEDTDRLATGLELGVNDYLVRPIDQNELLARARTQVRRKRYQDELRANYQKSMSMAMTDSLTGLFNRRYAMTHLEAHLERSRAQPVSLMMLDIDHFKSINDTYGHPVGDEVLVELSARIGRYVRGIDLAARLGGEEFVVVLPETDEEFAAHVAERLRRNIADEPFSIAVDPSKLDVTCSIGVAQSVEGDTPDDLLKRADDALYAAKRQGRDRVITASSQEEWFR